MMNLLCIINYILIKLNNSCKINDNNIYRGTTGKLCLLVLNIKLLNFLTEINVTQFNII